MPERRVGFVFADCAGWLRCAKPRVSVNPARKNAFSSPFALTGFVFADCAGWLRCAKPQVSVNPARKNAFSSPFALTGFVFADCAGWLRCAKPRVLANPVRKKRLFFAFCVKLVLFLLSDSGPCLSGFARVSQPRATLQNRDRQGALLRLHPPPHNLLHANVCLSCKLMR